MFKTVMVGALKGIKNAPKKLVAAVIAGAACGFLSLLSDNILSEINNYDETSEDIEVEYTEVEEEA